jgi:hypothetical protein
MTKVILLIDDTTTQSIRVARIPHEGEYVFYNNESLIVHRVIHIPKRFGCRALISVSLSENHNTTPDMEA